MHEGYHTANYFSNDFKNLISRLLHANPDERISIEEIRGHPWFVDPSTPTLEEIHTEFTLRKTRLGRQPWHANMQADTGG